MRKERNCRYGNENTAPQAVGSTLIGEGQIRKEVHCAGGNNTKTIALAIKTSKLTASVLQKAMKMYLEHQKHKEPSHGKYQ